MSKKVSVGVLLTAVLLSIALTVSVTMVIAIRYFNSTVSDVTQRQAMFDYVTDVDKIVRYHYYGTIDEEKLRSALGEGYIDGIGDPYAAYLSAEEYREALDTLAGKQTGFGLDVALSDNGRIVITRVHPQSTADKAGIQAGDVITAVNGNDVSASAFSQVNRTLADASKVLLSVQRGTTAHAFEISASTFDTVSVDSRMLESNVGYIRVYAVLDTTPRQFQTAYEALVKQGATRFVFDLRDNAGGSSTAVEQMLSFLVPSGSYAQQIDNTGKITYLQSENGHGIAYPSVTLVNGGTTGEAEVFAGVLQELGKTAVVGETTAGKGLIQEYFTNSDGSAVRLSVAERQLIKGGVIQGKGITPDEEVHLRGQLALTEQADDTPLQAALKRLKTAGQADPSATASATTTTGTQQAVTTAPSKVVNGGTSSTGKRATTRATTRAR